MACYHCHRIYDRPLLCPDGWNAFVKDLSGGLLYGHEVRRPPEFVVPRKRPHVKRRRPAPRQERVLHLLSRGLDSRAIAARMGLTYNSVGKYVRLLYKRHGGRNRAELCARAGLPYTRPMPRRRAQLLNLLQRGMTQRQIAARLGITAGCVSSHMVLIYRSFGVHGREQLLARLRGQQMAATRRIASQGASTASVPAIPPAPPP